MSRAPAELASDLRYGLRQIRKNPLLALLCIAVLGIGIGATTAVFAVLYDALLKPLPYRDAGRIVFVHNEFPASQLGHTAVSGPDWADLTAHHEIFSETAAYYFNDFTLSGTGDAGYAQHVDAVNTSATLFSMLGIRPELGRWILPEDDRYGAPRVAMLSDAFWRNRFGGDPQVLGKTIQLDGAPYQIAGVMPADFNFPYPATQMWVPLALPPADLAPDARGGKWLQMLGRIAPGATLESARGMLGAVGHRMAIEDPEMCPEKSGWHLSMTPMLDEQTSSVRQWLWLAFGAVACVLLIACTNVSSLLLVRATVRSREWAVRSALGASAGRLIRQILTETAMLAVAGSAAGLALSAFLVQLINTYGPVHRTQIEPWVLAFAVGVCMASTFISGLLPAVLSSRFSIEQTVRSGAGRTSTGQSHWRSALVASQITIAVALLFTATALSRSFTKLLEVSPGFSAERVWSASVGLPRKQYATGPSRAAFFRTLAERIRALPGVESASAGIALPFSSGGFTADLYFPGRPEERVRPAARIDIVLPDYFETLKIPLVKGRTFTARDGFQAPSMVVINEEFARKYFPGEEPIGKLVANNGDRGDPAAVIGVVGNVETKELGSAPQPQIYWAELQDPNSAMFVVARLAGESDITSAAREILRQQDANVALFDVEMMPQRILASVKLRRFVAWLMNSFGLVGMMLAALGLYGTLAYLVQLRRREIAIRMAFGATPSKIARLVLRHSVMIATAGLIPGLLLAAAAAQAIRSFLFGIGLVDAWTIAGTAVGLVALGLIATWGPVAKAIQVSTLETLREE
jgi:putative ABC transport system permease protein